MLRQLQETNAALRDVRELLRQQVRAGEGPREWTRSGAREMQGKRMRGRSEGWRLEKGSAGRPGGRVLRKGKEDGDGERDSGCGRDGEAKRGRRMVEGRCKSRWTRARRDGGGRLGTPPPSRPQVKEITFLKNMVMECDACGEFGGAAGGELRGPGAHGERPGSP